MAQTTSAKSDLKRELTIDPSEIEKRKKFVSFGPEDSKNLSTIKPLIANKVSELTKVFFDYLENLPEARPLFASTKVLEEARSLKREHLLAMVEGEYQVYYVDQRLRLGRLYSQVGLEIKVFLGAFRHLVKSVGELILRDFKGSPEAAFAIYASFEKVAFFDIGIITDVIVFDRERTIRQQQEAIRELSTPVLQLRERLLMLPIVGMIDTYRARMLTENLLRSIRSSRAKVVVIDITGVAAVDSKVANHLVQTVAACRLMGAKVIVTGLSAEVAQTLVTLGVDLFKLDTVGDLQGGIEEAERMMGYKVHMISETVKKDTALPAFRPQLEV
jgi:rsbT co-antagonist protein RsbR